MDVSFVCAGGIGSREGSSAMNPNRVLSCHCARTALVDHFSDNPSELAASSRAGGLRCVNVILCHTVANITVSVPDDVYRAARIRAAEQGSSVSALVAEYLRVKGQRESPLVAR